MVEEMYKEEFDVQASDNKREESQDNLITVDDSVQHHGLKLDHADRGIQSSDHGENAMDPRIGKLQGDQRFNMNNSNNNSPYYGDGCVMASTPATYDLPELGNIAVDGHVSLALELRNCESQGFGVSNDDMHKRHKKTLASSPETDLLDYHFTDPGKQQNKFGNPHLLHEFVV